MSAGGLLFSAYVLATTGRPWLFAQCGPDPPMAVAYLTAALRALIGLGLVVVALRDLRGPRLTDPLLLGLLLTFAGFSLIAGGTNGLLDGTAWIGPARRCIEIGAPVSYVISIFAIVAGSVALFAAASSVRTGGGEDD